MITLNPNNSNPHFCKCLYEIENKLTRTKKCFTPCSAQIKILSERENNKLNK